MYLTLNKLSYLILSYLIGATMISMNTPTVHIVFWGTLRHLVSIHYIITTSLPSFPVCVAQMDLFYPEEQC